MIDQDKQIIDNMIEFVEETEKEIQAAKLVKGSKTKAVTTILKELEKQIKNAD